MASKTTDPGLGGADSSKSHDTARTDPMSGVDATTDVTTPTSNRTDIDTDPGPERGDDLLEGLRRERPPPRLSPRIRAESEGGEAVAYYAGPQSLPARFDTPPPQEAIEIAVTPMSATTEPLPGAPGRIAKPVERKQALAETVPTRRGGKSPRVAMIVAVAVLFGGVLALWYALRMDRESTPQRTPGAAPPSSSAAVPASQTSATAPALAVSTPPVVAADTSSAPPVRIEATAPSARPTGRLPASASPGVTIPPPVRDPGRSPTPSTAPSADPHPTAPPSAPSAKIDHVRTI